MQHLLVEPSPATSASLTQRLHHRSERLWPGSRLDIQGHRGARARVVESTIESFVAAFDAGATGVELDVRLTADGHVVVWHDPRLEAEKCSSTRDDLIGARVDELTLDQLRTVDVGSRTSAAFPLQRPAAGAGIPTLSELLAVGRDRAPDIWWTIELKLDPTEPGVDRTRALLLDGVLAAVAAAGTGPRTLVHSFDWAALELAQQLAPELHRSALAVTGVTYTEGSPWLGGVDWRDHRDDLAGAAAAVGAHVVAPHHDSVDAELVARAHELGLGVLPWTVNDPDDLRRVVAAGVDGLITDDPELALSVLG